MHGVEWLRRKRAYGGALSRISPSGPPPLPGVHSWKSCRQPRLPQRPGTTVPAALHQGPRGTVPGWSMISRVPLFAAAILLATVNSVRAADADDARTRAKALLSEASRLYQARDYESALGRL